MLQFELTADDYVAANDLSARWSQQRWLRMILIAMVAAALLFWKMSDDPARALIMAAIYVSALMLALVAHRYVYLPWRARQVFAQTKALQHTYAWTWDDQQLRYKTDLANGIVPWANLSSWRENDTLFALYASPIAFFLFPKRAFSDAAAIEAFRATLCKKVVAAPRPETAVQPSPVPAV